MFRIFWFLVICSLGHRYVDGQHQGQRIAPGIPPEQYQQRQNHGGQQQMQQQIPQHQVYQQQQQQQQPPQQQIHQQQQQFQQQAPVQQLPVQHVPIQQQVPMQQHQQGTQQHAPVQHQGGHNHDHNSQNLLNANVAQEKAHIVEHLDVPMDTSKMTDQELQFHYFKMHDADNNNKLDGCELIKSLFHWHEHGNADGGSKEKVFTNDELVNLIDPILAMDDINKDGYIDYTEFIKAQQKAVAEGRQ